MFEAFLANTSVEGLRPLGTAPQRSHRSLSRLSPGGTRRVIGVAHWLQKLLRRGAGKKKSGASGCLSIPVF
jgi:hypothetical protein